MFICRGLETVRGFTNALLADFPAEAATKQLAPNGIHALWIVGHLAVSDEWIHGMIEPVESILPSRFKSLFGHNSTAVADSSHYPDLASLRPLFDQTRQNLIRSVMRAEASALNRPLGEEGVGFAETPLDAVNKIHWHEGWHAGQLSDLRRELALPGIFP
ncbi:MAG: DinB family protein [Phycisphaerales bacterium]|nr:MAG: DinB family protein [Phycisphaerales bacterium]